MTYHLGYHQEKPTAILDHSSKQHPLIVNQARF